MYIAKLVEAVVSFSAKVDNWNINLHL